MTAKNNLTVAVDAPFVNVKEFAKRTGQTEEAIRKQCRENKLPILPRENDKSPIFINMVLLFQKTAELEY